ncbi:MAG: pseudouridine synthase [Candidatus Colwellbacteria bacterium]|nr:pseudouridine synthase [Candidatus Colwellbacteria bacterium]
MKLRIQKYLSEQGICSRREAEVFIKEGLVSVNGKVVREMGVQIDPDVDKVKLLRGGEKVMGEKTSVVIYKPKGIVSSRVPEEGKTVYDLYPQFLKLNIVGRLDKESEGLLLLSNDGVVTKAVTGDEHLTEKEYEVTVREDIPTRIKRLFEVGIKLEDGLTLPAKVKVLSPHIFRIVLHEGRKHQIRRMCEFMRLTVVKLKRVRVGPVTLGKLNVGEHRTLSKEEVAEFKEVLGRGRI